MGMFDTIKLDKPYICNNCGNEIWEVQSKEFDNLLNYYSIGDCISDNIHDTRIVREELFCDKCTDMISTFVYLIVYNGILMNIFNEQEIKEKTEDWSCSFPVVSVEDIMTKYHDLYNRYRITMIDDYHSYRFLQDIVDWYREGMDKDYTDNRLLFYIFNIHHLKSALGPLDAISNFLNYKGLIKSLRNMKDKGIDNIDIYVHEDIKDGEESWWADISSDIIDEENRTNWTWTIMTEKYLEDNKESKNAFDNPEWVMIVNKPYSNELITSTIEEWLKDKRFDFKVRMMDDSEIENTIFYKRLMELSKDLNDSDECSGRELKEVMKEIEDKIEKETAKFIDDNKFIEKAFSYKKYYGSLSMDMKSKKLIGKIELTNMMGPFLYEGNTIEECEKEFIKLVDKLLGIRYYEDESVGEILGHE